MINDYKRYKFFDSQEVAPKSVVASSDPGLKRGVNSLLNKLFNVAVSALIGS